MNQGKKESYTEPVVVAHELLRDITAVSSAKNGKESDSKNFEF